MKQPSNYLRKYFGAANNELKNIQANFNKNCEHIRDVRKQRKINYFLFKRMIRLLKIQKLNEIKLVCSACDSLGGKDGVQIQLGERKFRPDFCNS